MKERIKKIRKALDLTQQEFAQNIGSTQNVLANYEIGRRNPSNSVINNICKTFNVNEEWLRTGNGEMFNPIPKSELESLIEKYGLSHEDFSLIEEFVNLKKEQRMVITEFIKKAAADFMISDPSILEEAMTLEESEQAYKKSLSGFAEKTNSIVSNTSAADITENQNKAANQ